MLSRPLVSDINGIGSVLCLLHCIMVRRGQFQIVDFRSDISDSDFRSVLRMSRWSLCLLLH